MPGAEILSPNILNWIEAGWVIAILKTGPTTYSAVVTSPGGAVQPYNANAGRAIDAAIALANQVPIPAPPSPPYMPDRLICIATVQPNGTFYAAPILRPGLTLNPDPHTPGSYGFTFGGVGVPAGYVIAATPFGAVGGDAFPALARQIAPGSPSFVVGFKTATRQLASGHIDPGGAFGGVGASIVHSATGVYDGTLITPPPPGTEFDVQATLNSSIGYTKATKTGAATFTVETFDQPGALPADLGTELLVSAVDNSPIDTGFQLLVWDATP